MMTGAIVFAVLSLLLALAFLYLLDLAIFWFTVQRNFQKRKTEPTYRLQLELLHKKKKHPIKKNLLLYILIQTLKAQGEVKKSEALIPFLKEDRLLGIKKEAS